MIWDLFATMMMQPRSTPTSDADRPRPSHAAARSAVPKIVGGNRFRLLDLPLPTSIDVRRPLAPDDPALFHPIGAVRERYHQRGVTAGAFDWSVATLQRRTDRWGQVQLDDGAVRKSWTVASDAGWLMPGGDRLSLGGRYTVARGATTPVVSAHPHSRRGIGIVEIGWDHRRDWRFAIGYRAVAGGAASVPLERGIDIANGAAIRERGLQATFTLRPVALSYVADVTVGAQAGQASIVGDEPPRGTAPGGVDRGVSLFAQMRF